MSVVRYLADLPRCWGECHHGHGRVPCTSPDLCAGAAAAMADAEAAGARMGMACAETTTQPADLAPLRTWPYAEHSRPGKLTEAELDRHIAERHERRPLPHLLLAKGAMTAHPAPTWLERLRKWWKDRRLARMGPRWVVR